ncbi:MAG: HAD hydrolase family protein [Spirochaeta sp.]|nr:HAD hydrolase family protein [Spirochaeta sp.]
MNRKLLALDLDGTILVDPHKLDEELSEILKLLALKGDIILFNTGRTFAYSRHIFKRLDFAFYGGFSNGVALASFPSREIIYEASLPAELLFETRR